MMNTAPMHVGGVLFEGFELLDFYGPLEMFGLLEREAKLTVVAEDRRSRSKQRGAVRHGQNNHGRVRRV